MIKSSNCKLYGEARRYENSSKSFEQTQEQARDTLLLMNLEKHSLEIDLTLINLERKEKLTSSNQEQLIKENGEEAFEMGMEFKSGLMGLDMKVNGRIIELMDRASLFMLTKMNMRGNGLMIKRMEEEFTDTKMEQLMMGTGKTISNMERVLRNGLMGVFIKENT